MKIIIMGAGIGGLSAAHFLKNHDVEIYERNEACGGQARSAFTKHNIFAEYCWHIVGGGYHTLLEIIEQVGARLVPISQFKYHGKNDVKLGRDFISGNSLGEKIKYLRELGCEPTKMDLALFAKLYIDAAFCRIFPYSYDKIKWHHYCRKFSPSIRRWIVDAPSIYLGMDTTCLSTHTMLTLFWRSLWVGNSPRAIAPYMTFAGPFHSEFFAKFNVVTNANIIRINTEGKKITSIDVNIDGKIFNKTADIFINALPIESFAALSKLPRYQELAEKTRQIQTQVVFFIDRKIDADIVVMHETPWFIMTRCEGNLWRENYITDNCPAGTKDIICAGIGLWYAAGANGKCAIDCDRDELADECWRQISANSSFAECKILSHTIWESYKFEGGKMNTYEPKYNNAANTLHLRPAPYEPAEFSNLYHATAYVRTPNDIFNMESAALAAKMCAEMIMSPLRRKWFQIKKWLGFI